LATSLDLMNFDPLLRITRGQQLRNEQSTPIPGREKFIDTLRGLAIVGVVLIHSKNFAVMGMTELGIPETKFLSDLSDFGMYGVELFFGISGYLISGLYPRGTHSRYWATQRYLIKRLLRIWPLWIIFSFLGFLIGLQAVKDSLYNPWSFVFADYGSNSTPIHHPLAGLLLTILFLGFLSPLLWGVVPGGWSIQNEMANYFLYALLRRRSLRAVLWTLVSLGLAQSLSYIVHLDAYHPLEVLGRLNAFSSACFFYVGVVFQILLSSGENQKDFVNELKEKPNLILFATILLALIVNPLTFGNAIGAMGFILVAVLFGLFLNRLGADGPLAILGRLSYFIYFSHFAVLYLFADPIWSYSKGLSALAPIAFQAVLTFAFLALCFLVSTPLAALSWRYIEKPIIHLGERLMGRANEPDARSL
jgi:peptidoglycan/LPS O-acetylase OafA/YrhL